MTPVEISPSIYRIQFGKTVFVGMIDYLADENPRLHFADKSDNEYQVRERNCLTQNARNRNGSLGSDDEPPKAC